MSTPRKIVFVAGDLANGGGANRVIRDLAAIFAQKLGAEVTVLSVGSSGPPTYPYPPEVTVERTALAGLGGYFEVIKHLRRTRPDTVISSWTQDNILLAAGLLGSRIELIAVEHIPWHFHSRWIRFLRRITYPLADHVVVLNPGELRHYGAYLSNVTLLPNPVPATQLAGNTSREKLILAIGHLEPRKNFADAIRAMALSGLENHGWSLAIIGSGSEQAALERQIASLGLERTRIVPPTNDLASWYSRASLLLLTPKLEVFSLVLAEAMAAGVIPIAYAADGPAFVLEEFPKHLVSQSDVGELAARLREFASLGSAKALRSQLSESIRSRFSVDVVTRGWAALLGMGVSPFSATAAHIVRPSAQT